MNSLNILGHVFFFIGVIILLTYALYKFFEDIEMPAIVEIGAMSIVVGVIIYMISIIFGLMGKLKA